MTVRATEKSSSYPFSTIIGIIIAPNEDTSATAEPEIPPKKVLSNTFTIARPPRTRPTIKFAKSTILRAIPPCPIISPAIIKNGIANKLNTLTPFTINKKTDIKGTFKYKAVTTDEIAREKVIGILAIVITAKEPNKIIIAMVLSGIINSPFLRF